jgi:hypothetical protein
MITEEKKYLVLYDKNPNTSSLNNQYEAYLITEGEFLRDENEDFERKKKWAIEKNIRIFYIEVKEPIIKIIPEAKVIVNKKTKEI